MKNKKKTLLIILDGWGLSQEEDRENSAIAKTRTPFMDRIRQEHSCSKLQAHGEAVGLPEGQMGNSEVGHINIGAGRVVTQELVRIDQAISRNDLQHNKVLLDSLSYAEREGKKVHFMGLVSDGGIHSHIRHLKALCEVASEQQLKRLYVHAFTDGRDTDPKSGIGFLEDLEEHLQRTTGKLATIMGRYYAMDRGKNWDRTAQAYRALVRGEASSRAERSNWRETLDEKYRQDETDEFLEPVVLTEKGNPVATIDPGDVVICFNFRTDRARQITQALTQENRPDHDMRKMDLRYITMTPYDQRYRDVKVLFENEDLVNTLGETLSRQGRTQIRIAETIKYPHVTYFFSGGREKEFSGEERIMISSPEVPTFDQKPEMSAEGIRDAIIPRLEEAAADFICLNFANPDMVGHSGNMDAAIIACEAVDSCCEAVSRTALEHGYTVVITADHGNAEKMKNPDGSPFTAHTTNPVPLIVLGMKNDLRPDDGRLGDIAPTILGLMGLEIPEEMSGRDLLRSSR